MDAKLLAELKSLGNPLSLSEVSPKYSIWIYGEPGSGKTDLAGRLIAQSGKPAALISSDSAWVTLLKNPKAAELTTRYPYSGFSQVRAIAQAAIEGIEPYCNYGTLVWDTLSTSIEWTLGKLVQSKKFRDQIDSEAASWTHYNLVQRALGPVVDDLNKAPFDVIYLSHVRQPNEQDAKKQIFAIRPNTPEACFRQVAGEVQLIGWLNKEKTGGKRVLQVEGTNTTTAKSQIFSIPEGKYPVEEIPALIAKMKANPSESASAEDVEAIIVE